MTRLVGAQFYSSLLCACLLVGVHTGNVWGAGQLDTRVGHGLRMEFDTRWPAVAGYRPLHLEFTPVKPSAADRTLRLEFAPRAWYGGTPQISVTQFVEIPAGTEVVKAKLSVPQLGVWNSYDLWVYEDGSELKKLRLQVGTGGYDDGTPTTAILKVQGSSRADITMNDNTTTIQTGNASIRCNEMSLPLSELPESWQQYSGIDIVMLTYPQLSLLADSHTARFNALRAWVQAGGNLWVVQCGAKWENLPHLEKYIHGTSPEGASLENNVALEKRGWLMPYVPTQKEMELQQNRNGYYGESYPNPMIEEMKVEGKSDIDNQVNQNLKEVERLLQNGWSLAEACGQVGITTDTYNRWKKERESELERRLKSGAVMWRPLGLGVVVAAKGQEFSTFDFWQIINNASPSNLTLPARILWSNRLGISPQGHCQDFWEFLIPGVGMAPVGVFQILITVFVLGIGPLNYWFLKRYHRLHLLVVTTPVCAAAITFSLFGYGLASDGFGVRGRVRSFTFIDQQAGWASCNARMSFYAGLAPYGGMQFPPDVTVYPVQGGYEEQKRGRTLHWEEDQYLENGWLSSRTPTQFVTARSRKSDIGLTITSPANGKPLTIENRLGTPIQQLLLCDKDGSYYWLENLAAGAQTSLEKIDSPKDVRLKMAQAFQKTEPVAPAELDPNNANYGFGGRRYYYNYGRYDSPLHSSALLEKTLHHWMSPTAPPLPRGSYVAVVEQSPEVAHGVSSVAEEASYHLIMGTW